MKEQWTYQRISVYLGLGGFSWKMPFISQDTRGCFPTHVPFSKVISLDKARRTVLMVLLSFSIPNWGSECVNNDINHR